MTTTQPLASYHDLLHQEFNDLSQQNIRQSAEIARLERELAEASSQKTAAEVNCADWRERAVRMEALAADFKHWQEINACDVCGNVPDAEGILEHGRGCYVEESDGGGMTILEEYKPTTPPAAKESPMDANEALAEMREFLARDESGRRCHLQTNSAETNHAEWQERAERAEASAKAWEETCRVDARNRDFWRNIVISIGELFGDAAKTSDDGSLQDSVLALKVLPLVESRLTAADALANAVEKTKSRPTCELMHYSWLHDVMPALAAYNDTK